MKRIACVFVIALLWNCSDDTAPPLDASVDTGDRDISTDVGPQVDKGPQADKGPQVDKGPLVDNGPQIDSGPKPDMKPAPDQSIVVDGSVANCQPKCQKMGSKSEGWYDGCSNALIKWDQCAKCKALCKDCGPGCKSNGWYSNCNLQSIKYTTCTECKPKCDAVGTYSEGWYDSCTKKLIKYEKCAKCTVTCKNCGLGCMSNGYYSSCSAAGLAIKYVDCVP